MWSTACVRTQTKLVPILPPSEYTQDCAISAPEIKTNGDLVLALRDARQDTRVCNADKKALRAWSASMEQVAKAIKE